MEKQVKNITSTTCNSKNPSNARKNLQVLETATRPVVTEIEKKIDITEVENLHRRLDEVLHAENGNKWEATDIVYKLNVGYGVSLTHIAQVHKVSVSTLSDYKKVGQMYPEALGTRDKAPYWIHSITAAAIQAVQRDVSRQIGSDYVVDPAPTIDEVVAQGLDNKGEIVNYLMGKARKECLPERPPVPPADGVVNNFHHEDFRTVLAQMEDYSVQVVMADPPYLGGRDFESGRLRLVESAGVTGHDGQTEAERLELTCAIFPGCARKLKKNGVILLWQASFEPLPAVILAAMKGAGFRVLIMVTWNKTGPQMGDPAAPWVPQSEMLYVICREGEEDLANYAHNLWRGNVIDFPPVEQRQTLLEMHHKWAKPYDLVEFLILKHSAPGDIIFDAFGASGSTALAAHRNGRQWVYCESNQQVFDEFAPRLVRDMKAGEGEEPKAA